MNGFLRFIKHLMLISKHKWIVFKLSIKAGIPIRGLLHDLSKYSITEFFEGVKFFNGKVSPISKCKEKNGYSEAWLHHIGRNKHHIQYWTDYRSDGKFVAIYLPYKYMVEMICDRIAAGIVYEGKEWTVQEPLEYWLERDKKRIRIIHPGTVEFIEVALTELSNSKNLKNIINKKYLKTLYNNIEKKYSKTVECN